MKRKRGKKRAENELPLEIRQTAITLNMNYVDVSPLRLERLLPPLPEFDESRLGGHYCLPQTQKYCAYQVQQDSGDVFIFFLTRWKQRRGIHLHRLLQTPTPAYSPVVFALTHNAEMLNFYEKLGYDIPWHQILEIKWDAFSQLMIKLLTESLQSLLISPEPDTDDCLAYSGDLRWVPELYRDVMHRIGTKPSDAEWRAKIER
ncbi:MAG: hypothetical protein OXI43_02755 [Candidatus Poribacteria bacterium]|nr:hypothetical protein [Candidatus Poribacteria bacterium]